MPELTNAGMRDRLRAVIEWVSERDHGKAVELDTVVAWLEADAITRQATLKGMTVEDGATVLELGPPRELIIAWVNAAREWLGTAPNYVETVCEWPKGSVSMEVKAAGEFERYAFTLQRVGKLTPHQAREQAESERATAVEHAERADALIRRLTEALQDLISNSPDPGTEALGAVWEGKHWHVSTVNEAFGITCIECVEAITDDTDDKPWGETEHGPVHLACADDGVL